jgi:hypothetical protein
MLNRDWYDPVEDDNPEVMWWRQAGLTWQLRYQDWRVRGDQVGEFTVDEWAACPQIDRCRWYVDWYNRRLQPIADANPDRFVVGNIEDLERGGLVELCEAVGFTPRWVPREVPHISDEAIEPEDPDNPLSPAARVYNVVSVESP